MRGKTRSYYINKLKALEKASPEEYIAATIFGKSIDSGGAIFWKKLNESSRIYQWITKQINPEYAGKATWGIISAWRPEIQPDGSGERTREENEKATRELIGDLRREGYGFVPVKGVARDAENNITYLEYSFFIPGIIKTGDKKILVDYEDFARFLSKLAKKFNQDSFIIYNPHEDKIELWEKTSSGSYEPGDLTWNYPAIDPKGFIEGFRTEFKKKAFQFQRLAKPGEEDTGWSDPRPQKPDPRLFYKGDVKPKGKDLNKNGLSESQEPSVRFVLYEGWLRVGHTWMEGVASKPNTIVFYEFLSPAILAKEYSKTLL